MEAEDVCLPEGGHRNTNPLTVTLLQLSHLGGLLHPEVDLVGVLTNHLQIIAQLLSVIPGFCLLLTKLPLA